MRSSFGFVFCLLALCGRANVSLPSYISDNMVLQRNAEVVIWGYASPMEEVTVITSWNHTEYKARGDHDARFAVTVRTGAAGGPYTLTVKGWNEIVVRDILLGEVWLCSGQSNMEMTPEWGLDDSAAEIAAATDPYIRFATLPKRASDFPQDDIPLQWVACSPENMKRASSVAYFFAQRLREELKDVPVGLVISAWGGTPAEIWMPEQTVLGNERLRQAASALTAGSYGPIAPGRAYNAMIHPMKKMRIAGALWYQGESNVGSDRYEATLSSLIASWRKDWGYDFPFYFVQIAPYAYGDGHVSGSVIRNAQRKVPAMVPKTGMVVIADISVTDDIHPRNKKPVGRRLAALALKEMYDKGGREVYGPAFSGFRTDGKKGVVAFGHADGLRFQSGKSTLFELAGPDGIFHPAQARIKGGTVVVTSGAVNRPLRVRYAFRNTDRPDLFNAAGLPASTFDSE